MSADASCASEICQSGVACDRLVTAVGPRPSVVPMLTRRLPSFLRTKLLQFALVSAIGLMLGGGAIAGDLSIYFPGTHTGWVIETPAHKVYVIDPGVSGEFYDSRPKQAEGVGTYLKNRKISRIDAVIISHPHPDHFAAAVELFRDFHVLELVDSGFNPHENKFGGYNAAFWNAFKTSGAQHRTVHAGTMLDWDKELVVKVCGPKQPFWTFAEAGKDPERYYNQNSVVLWVKHGPFSCLLTGDITAPAQNFLRSNYPAEVKATTVVGIPHHGKYYLSEPFAKFVGSENPSARIGIASISHTHKGAAADRVPAWRNAGLNVYTGDRHNDITVQSNGRGQVSIRTAIPPGTKLYDIGQSGAHPGTLSRP